MTQPRITIEDSCDLPEAVVPLIQRLFADHQQVIVKKEFSGNFSGSRVFLVQPIAESGATLPIVVKLAATSLIKREWSAYEAARPMLYGLVQIQARDLSPTEDWGALCYPLQGGGVFAIESLSDYLEQHPSEVIVPVLRRLFQALGSIHNQSQACPGFSWRSSYDSVLPLNLLISATSPPAHTPFKVVNAANPDVGSLQPGDWVRLEGFAVTKVDLRRQTLTLNVPHTDPPNAFYVRVKMIEVLPVYEEGQVIPAFEGQILATRQSQLQSYAHALLGDGTAALAESVVSIAGLRLPNPFLKIPAILNQYRNVRTALIHGDLNLRNILVDAEIGSVSLIDIAEARQDHILHDFLRMETEIVTHLLAAELYQQQFSPAQMMVEFYQCLHCATWDEGYITNTLPTPLHKYFEAIKTIRQAARRHFYGQETDEYYQGLLLYLIGTLKFANLDEHPAAPLPKQTAFWGAAAIAQLLEATPACKQLPALESISQPPHALLLSYNPEVKVLRQGAECFSPAAYGMPLHIGDVVSTFANAEATVHCAQGALIVIPPERNQRIDCGQTPPERVRTRLDLRYPAPFSYLVNEFMENMMLTPEAISPMGLSPRNTRIAESRPTFRWQPQPGATTYRLSVRAPGGEHWQHETIDPILPYPAAAPSLNPGSGNTVILEALGAPIPPEIAYLEVLDSDSLKQLQRMEAEILSLSLAPAATVCLFAQLYQNWGLWTAAVEQLEQMQLVAARLTPAIRVQLGECYLRVGDYTQAEKQYEIAQHDTTRADDTWAVAHIGLACALYAQNHPALARQSLAELEVSAYAAVAQHIRAQFENALPAPPRYQGAINVITYARFLAQHIAAHLADEIRQIPDRFLEQLQSLSSYALKPAGAWNTLGPDKFAPLETLAATYLTTQALLHTLSDAEIRRLNQTGQWTPHLEEHARHIAQETLGLPAAQAQDFAQRYANLVAADPDILLRLSAHKGS